MKLQGGCGLLTTSKDTDLCKAWSCPSLLTPSFLFLKDCTSPLPYTVSCEITCCQERLRSSVVLMRKCCRNVKYSYTQQRPLAGTATSLTISSLEMLCMQVDLNKTRRGMEPTHWAKVHQKRYRDNTHLPHFGHWPFQMCSVI